MKIEMDLSDDQIAFLVRALDWPPSKTREELAQAWLSLAVEAWWSWLSGEKRYNSLTEQYTDWIEKIYENLLQTEAPSVERLFNSFNVPYGQAQYIARVLNNRETARWREEARKELKAKLLELKDKISKLPQKDETVPFGMMLSKAAADELGLIVGKLFRQSPGKVDMPSSSGWRMIDFVAVRITARTFNKVCEQLAI